MFVTKNNGYFWQFIYLFIFDEHNLLDVGSSTFKCFIGQIAPSVEQIKIRLLKNLARHF